MESDSLLFRLARPGVWPAISGLVVYDGRVWLTNSQPYEDNNAADIYSYDPATSKLRFERGLFSQDVGMPAVVDGRLFLPFEDPRFNMSAGEYAVTDGRSWRWRRLPEGTAFHTHAIGRRGDELFAATGAWEGQLHVSPDDGRTWRLASTYPAREAKFSRLIAITSWKDRCFVGASARGRRDGKLLEWREGELKPVAGWPVSDALRQLTTFEDPDIGRRLSERLAALDIKDRLRFFSRERVKRAHRLGWYLLGAIAVNGHGRIPPELLGVPLSTRQNDRRKNLDAPIAAIATVGWVAQDDRQTIEVLMERLRQVQGEPWLTSDVIAALTALTGQKLGHDVERWQSWGEQRNRWRPKHGR